MSVLFETSVGDIVVDLETSLCPRASTNFIKLAKSYYYNYATFFSVQSRFLAQTGDPTNTGAGGESIWSRAASVLAPADRYFVPEMVPSLKHRARGTLSLALIERPDPKQPGQTQLVAGSQFFITLADRIDYFDGKHAVIGHVVEGGEPGGALDKLDAAFVDEQNRPLTDIRIRGISVLDDPFPDPPGLRIPSRTPSPTPEQLASIRLSEAEAAQKDDAELAPEEREEKERAKNSKAAALTLEMVGDLPFAEIRPPENILFVCKLNPVTRSEDLELIFSRFGQILTCEVIKDKKVSPGLRACVPELDVASVADHGFEINEQSGDSLQYAFIEFAEKESAEQAYFKMQNTLIDDRRIWVDFSQSVSKLHGDWLTKRLGGRKPPADKLVQEGRDGQPPRGGGGGSGGGSSGHRPGYDAYPRRDREYERRRDDYRGGASGPGRDRRDQDDRDRRRRDDAEDRYRRHDTSRRRDDASYQDRRERGDDRDRDWEGDRYRREDDPYRRDSSRRAQEYGREGGTRERQRESSPHCRR
ncbi:hypothetical protein V8E36_003860 [Tilletia maclaganii]